MARAQPESKAAGQDLVLEPARKSGRLAAIHDVKEPTTLARRPSVSER